MDVELIDIFNACIYDIDIEKNKITRFITDDDKIKEKNMLDYSRRVIIDIYTPPKRQTLIKGQYYNFTNTDELIPQYLSKINIDPYTWEEYTKKIAEKLLSVESEAYLKVGHLNGIRKGSLLQIQFKHNGLPKIALTKIDTIQYLNEVLQINSGLPIESRVQKTAVVSFNNSNTIESLLVSDTTSKISAYWQSTFLQAEPVLTNSQNTQNAFEAIDHFLKIHIKKISKQDFYYIRNKVILDFRKESFEFNNLINDLQNYKPINKELEAQFNDILIKFQELPISSKKPFDTQFDIDPSKMKAKLQNKVLIDENFDLLIKTPVENLQTVLQVGDDDGGKFIKIYSDDGYNMLKRD